MQNIPGPGFTLLTGGQAAFERVLHHIRLAQRRIEARIYIWRDDATGQGVAQALLDAADRGVQITLLKDADAATHERHEGCAQSLLHKQSRLKAHMAEALLYGFYSNRIKRLKQQPSALAEALRAHPNITLEDGQRYDHAKVFVFDERTVMLGGMCLGDDAHHELLDYMVECHQPALVTRYRARCAGEALDASRAVDFLVNQLDHPEDLRAQRLALIDGAQHSLRVEMAFFGDPAFTDALVAAVNRGVQTTILAARRAGKLRWYNPQVFNQIRRRTRSPKHLRIALYPTGVHAKLMVIDEAIVDLGSANFTTLSHDGYAEVNLLVRDAAFATALAARMDAHVHTARLAVRRIRASRVRAGLEHHFMKRAGRRALGALTEAQIAPGGSTSPKMAS